MVIPTSNISFSTISAELGGTPASSFSLSNADMRSYLSTGPATPGAAISVSSVNNAVLATFSITTNTANYVIYDALVAAGWNAAVPGSRITANVNVSSPSPTINTVVYSTSTPLAALDTGALPTSANVKITIVDTKSYVIGMGGDGGAGSPGSGPTGPNGSPGKPGGDAIGITSAKSPVTIVNNGTVGGGGGGGGGGWGQFTPCLSWDSKILLSNGTTKNIKDIVPGDKLKTLTGVEGTVLKLSPTILGKNRKFIKIKSLPNSKPLRITDDHELWIKDGFIETFGVYNYNSWLDQEVQTPSHNSGDRIYPMKALLPFNEYTFATTNGWVTTTCEWETGSDPEEEVYCILMDKGVGFIADGFVVANDDFYEHELDGVHWRGV